MADMEGIEQHAEYIVQERAVGQRIQVMVSAGGTVTFGDHEKVVGTERDAHPFARYFEGKARGLLDYFKRECNHGHIECNLFGTLTERSVYGIQRLVFYDFYRAGGWLDPTELYRLFSARGWEEFLIPYLCRLRGLNLARNYDPTGVPSQLVDIQFEGDELSVAGVVIKSTMIRPPLSFQIIPSRLITLATDPAGDEAMMEEPTKKQRALGAFESMDGSDGLISNEEEIDGRAEHT